MPNDKSAVFVCLLLQACAEPGPPVLHGPAIVLTKPMDQQYVFRDDPVRVELVVAGDRGPHEVEVQIDGVVAASASLGEEWCSPCVVHLEIPTFDLDDGSHDIGATVRDRTGDADSLDPIPRFTLGPPIDPQSVVKVRRIEISQAKEQGFNGTRLEVEVHMRVADEGRTSHLGCSDLDGEVQFLNQEYIVEDGFLQLDGTRITYGEIADRDIRLVVVESEPRHCPEPLELSSSADHDDLIGESLFYSADAFPWGAVLSFPGVPQLVLSTKEVDDLL